MKRKNSGPIRKAKATPAPKTPQQRRDSWESALTGIGYALRDKRMASNVTANRLTQAEEEEFWRGDDMAARIVETVPNELTREGFELQIAGDENDADASARDSKDVEEAMMAEIDTLDVLGVMHKALCYRRAYGGGGILLGADDGQDYEKPLNLEAIRNFGWMSVLTPRELTPQEWYSDPKQAKYGEVKVYRLQRDVNPAVSAATTILVHESRVVRFEGIVVSRAQLQEKNGWGDSVLSRVVEVVRDYQQAWQGTGILLQDFAQAVMRMKGLSEVLASDGDSAVVVRAQQIDMARSVARMVLLDTDEEFERKVTPVAGLPELLQQFSLRLAAAADMPVTLLMGQAPAGLNATGESDIRFFYDRIAAEQRRYVRPRLNRILEVLFHSKVGPTNGKEPENWTVKFNPLWQLSDLQKAELRFKQAQVDQIYITQSVATPEEIATSRFGGDEYSAETTIDFQSREEMALQPEPEPEDKPTPDEPTSSQSAA